jgi:hypothetical protein
MRTIALLRIYEDLKMSAQFWYGKMKMRGFILHGVEKTLQEAVCLLHTDERNSALI